MWGKPQYDDLRGRGGTAPSQERKTLAMLLILEITLNKIIVYTVTGLERMEQRFLHKA